MKQHVPVRKLTGIFALHVAQYRRVVMLAAGTGIAPMAQVAGSILNDEDDETVVRLVYACRRYSDILLKPRMDAWCDFWNFSVVYMLSQVRHLMWVLMYLLS